MAKRALGKGLSALLGDSITPARAIPRTEAPTAPGPAMLGDREAVLLPLEGVRANPQQPRKVMNENTLQELAASIRQSGVLQPVLVRRVDDGYELVAGERRLRAARLAGLREIPALVCTLEESESLRVALLENIQREDLNAVEEAQAYRAIMERYGATQQELADMLGKNRSTVTNTLRLLTLEPSIQDMVTAGDLSMGHARALLAVEDSRERLSLARDAVRQGLPVRALERKAQRLVELRPRVRGRGKRGAPDPEAAAVREFESRLQQKVGAPVRIRRRGKRGRIEIQFFSDLELEQILEAMGVSSQL
jgi:ParB family chromosome partitioning protein